MRLTDDAVQVYVEWANADTSPRASLIGAAAEVETESTTQRITQARVPITALNVVGALPGVSRVRLPDYPQLNAVTTQGDALQHLAALRTAASVDGTGITVGVISDGINRLQASITAGDLPATTLNRSGTGVNSPGSAKLTSTTGGVIAQSFRADGDLEAGLGTSGAFGAEGTAILEIVHDIAPGAQLRFANFNTSVEFMSAVNFLAANSDVVIDDVSWLTPPYDGTSAVSANTNTALNNASNPIRAYATSAGNQAQVHWRGTYVDSGIDIGISGQSGRLHGFQTVSNSSFTTTDGCLSPNCPTGSRIFNSVLLAPGASAYIQLSWNDPAGASTNNYNLIVDSVDPSSSAYPQAESFEAWSLASNTGTGQPERDVTVTNSTGSTRRYDIFVWNDHNAAASKTLDFFILNSAPAFQTLGGSVLAQGDARGGVISVGGVSQAASTAIDSYSSRGPTVDGRTKPDVVATDCVTTGVVGFTAFCGTSASAPHVAGLAALLLQAHPRLQNGNANALSAASARTLLRNMITGSAIDLGAAGVDNVFGNGLIDGTSAYNTAGPGSQLSYASGPANGVTGVFTGAVSNGLFYLQPVIQVKDALGHAVNTATDTVTIAIKNGTGTVGASLLGTAQRAAINGVATFTDLKIDQRADAAGRRDHRWVGLRHTAGLRDLHRRAVSAQLRDGQRHRVD